MMTKDELQQLIEQVYEAQRQNDEEKIFDLSADIMSVYLEALSDIYFEGEMVEWLNEIVESIDEGDTDELVTVLERVEDSEAIFLGSQIASIFAGFRQRDSMAVVAQAAGLKALLAEM